MRKRQVAEDEGSPKAYRCPSYQALPGTQYAPMMLYMVIERFKETAAPEVYRRFAERGRMLPDGLSYLSSWIDQNTTTCWQLMETDDPSLFEPWIAEWSDLVDFEVVPVRVSTGDAS